MADAVVPSGSLQADRRRAVSNLPRARRATPSVVDDVVTVLLGRFEPLVGIGLTRILRSDQRISVIGSDLEGRALQREARRQLPRVAIVDEAVEPLLLRRLRASQPSIGVVVLAEEPSPEYGMRVLAAGASCLSRSATVSEILASVHLTARGGRVFTAPDDDQLKQAKPAGHSDLTAREIEVLALIRAKKSNREIARELHLSVNTVKSHVTNVRRKLEVKRKSEC
jgi:two-component system, NarL family, response regulator LiaR